jgi:hypothetical protein
MDSRSASYGAVLCCVEEWGWGFGCEDDKTIMNKEPSFAFQALEDKARNMEQGIRIRTIILLCLLLSGIASSNAQDYSTWGEIYDYNIGDLFHYTDYANGNQGGGYLKYTNSQVIDKEYSSNGDTVIYTMWIEEAYSEVPTVWTYSSYQSTKIYYDLDLIFNADSVYYNSNYNGRKISYDEIINNVEWFEGKKYVDGCGRVNHTTVYKPWQGGWEEIKNLVYYKKGEEEWGTPNPVVGITELKTQQNYLNTFPNPFTTSTTIEYELKEISNIQFTIYNVIGEVVYMTEDRMMTKGKHNFIWSTEGLSEGLYYAVLRSEEGVAVVKMIKQ